MKHKVYCFRCDEETTERFYNVVIREVTKDDKPFIYYESFCPKCYEKIWANAILKVAEIE